MFTRKLEEWDTKWTALQAKFQKIKSGPELEQEFRGLKQQLVGMPTKQVVHRDKITDVDVTRPRSTNEIEVINFDFVASVCISVDGSLYAFEADRRNNKINVRVFEHVSDYEEFRVINLPPL